jgi:hypothetical protein
MGHARHTSPAAGSHRRRALALCPRCDSRLVQPQGWKEIGNGMLMLHLRCPECQIRTVGSYEAEHVARFDRQLVRARERLEADYLAMVRENMGELAERFGHALELDLIGPDDFRPRPAAGHGLQSSARVNGK